MILTNALTYFQSYYFISTKFKHPKSVVMGILLKRVSLCFNVKMFQHQNRNQYSSYQRTLNALHCLQSNKQVLADSSSCQYAESKIAAVEKFFSRCGLDVEFIEKKLSVIHVAGTKGKGSTCAYCESILRQFGYKTGFYSSPHLVSVRETIRINGQPISRQKFEDYFWEIYGKLCAGDNYKNAPIMPPYFTFLTIMAFKVFIEEKVDVAIVEVGIGGEYDCTNVLKQTAVVGITSIDYDHVKLLGRTIEEIAWQKAGIMKRDCIAITVCHQHPAVLNILCERASERNCTLFVTGNMKQVFSTDKITLGINSPAQPLNASLGAQLANAWMNPQLYKKGFCKSGPSVAPIFPLTNEISSGISTCRWPGRTQILRISDRLTFYLDGAHTSDSIQNCIQWYMENTPKESKKALVFNMTGDRDPSTMIEMLIRCQFEYTFFCPNSIDPEKTPYLEYTHQNEDQDEDFERAKRNCSDWIERSKYKAGNNVRVFKNVNETYDHLKNTDQVLHILITGSLHLVGAFLSILDPDLNTYSK